MAPCTMIHDDLTSCCNFIESDEFSADDEDLKNSSEKNDPTVIFMTTRSKREKFSDELFHYLTSCDKI